MQIVLALIIIAGLFAVGWFGATFVFDGITTLIGGVTGAVVGAIIAGMLKLFE